MLCVVGMNHLDSLFDSTSSVLAKQKEILCAHVHGSALHHLIILRLYNATYKLHAKAYRVIIGVVVGFAIIIVIASCGCTRKIDTHVQ